MNWESMKNWSLSPGIDSSSYSCPKMRACRKAVAVLMEVVVGYYRVSGFLLSEMF